MLARQSLNFIFNDGKYFGTIDSVTPGRRVFFNHENNISNQYFLMYQ